MPPEIRYARASDGVRIAYFDIGRGPTLVDMPNPPFDNVELTWNIDEFARTYELMSAQLRCVKYDLRGFGASTRGVPVSLDAAVQDIETVVDALNLERFLLNAWIESTMPALVYASRHPERVIALTLRDATRGAPFAAACRRNVDLARTNWEAASRALADTLHNVRSVAALRQMNDLIVRTADGDTYARYIESVATWDATPLLEAVNVPVFISNDGIGATPVDETRHIASLLPNASFFRGEGARGEGLPSDAAVTAFMQRVYTAEFQQHRRQRDDAAGPPQGLRVVLFTDLVAHTSMMRRLGDDRGREVLRMHEQITRDLLRAHGGSEVKAMGDGFMASFASATRAVDCAIALQRALAERNASHEEPLQVRVGLNAGEPIAEDGDLFGATVILASRIAAAADGGEILIAEPMRHLLAGKTYTYADRGEVALKGFDDAVRLYEVVWHE